MNKYMNFNDQNNFLHILVRVVLFRRAKLGKIPGGGCRGPAKIRQRGGCNNLFYFLRDKNITF